MSEDIKKDVLIPVDSIKLKGILAIPETAQAIVVFAHGSGSGRLSVRNNFVADFLNKNNFATLLFDLLTEEEELIYEKRFDTALLTSRLISTTDWIKNISEAGNLKIGYFGASTGAAAALQAASFLKKEIYAIVSRGGRPDLAENSLRDVTAPTLLIVGGKDDVVLKLNKKVLSLLKIEKELKTIPKATHLFEEPGALEEVARLAAEWFKKYSA